MTPEDDGAGSAVREVSQPTSSTPRVIGRYALYDAIASGGMATVHYGRLIGAAGFSRTVAIKKLHKPYARNREFVAMFLDEARMVGRIRHPNVVPVLDVLSLGGELLLVLEYVHGEALSRLLQRTVEAEQTIPWPIVASIMTDVLHGLHAAHEAKNEQGEPLEIVHRDVSPQNIVVGADGVARVLDFGVAKALGRLTTTRNGLVKGKFAYMAPEQGAGTATRRSDVFCAAIVLWEALTARRLFTGENDAVLWENVHSQPIVPPSRLVPSVPPSFDAIVLRGLAREPDKRFPTARDMALAIEACGAHAPASEVGAWVEHLAGEALSRKQAAIAEIERANASGVTSLSGVLGPGSAFPDRDSRMPTKPDRVPPVVDVSVTAKMPVPAPPPAAAAEPPPPVAIPLAPPSPESSGEAVVRSSRGLPPTVIGAALAFLAGVVIVVLVATWNRPSAPPPQPVAPSAASTGGSAEPSGSVAALPEPSGSPEAPMTASAPAPSAPPARRPRSGTGKAAATRSCDPPYSVDSAGHVHFRPECVQ